MEKPKRSALSTYTTLELLDRTFRVYRDNFLTFLVPIAIVTIPITILSLVSSIWSSERMFLLSDRMNDLQRLPTTAQANSEVFSLLGETLSVFWLVIVISLVTSLLQVVLVNGLITQLASETHLGYRSTAIAAFNAVKDRLLYLGVGTVLLFIIIGALAFGLSLILFACGLGFGFMIYVWLALTSFFTPVIVLERTNIGLGIRRAWSLGKARIWQIFGLIFCISIITFVLNLALTTLVGIFAQETASTTIVFTPATILQLVLQSIIAIILTPVLPIALTLLYYDARVRYEGLDIVMQTTEVDEPRPANLESPTPDDPFLANKDLSNIGIMTAITIGIVAIYFCGASLFVQGVSSF